MKPVNPWLLLLVLCLNAFTFRGAGLEVVKTQSGLVPGVRSAAGGVVSFKGIPFAAPLKQAVTGRR